MQGMAGRAASGAPSDSPSAPAGLRPTYQRHNFHPKATSRDSKRDKSARDSGQKVIPWIACRWVHTKALLTSVELRSISKPRSRNSKKAGGRPASMQSVRGPLCLLCERAGLLHPRGRRIAGNRAAVMEDGRIRDRSDRREAEGEKRCANEVFHRNSPSLVGRDVRLWWRDRWTYAGQMIMLHCGIRFMRRALKASVSHALSSVAPERQSLRLPAGAERIFSEQVSSVASRGRLTECLAFLRDGLTAA
jgi:hypothetical protein